MAFIERRLADDPTNWWAPNHAAVVALLRSCRMRIVERPGRETYLCVPDQGLPPAEEWDWSDYHAVTGLLRDGRAP
jgi:tRNA (mo5U34)-methyltransferase